MRLCVSSESQSKSGKIQFASIQCVKKAFIDSCTLSCNRWPRAVISVVLHIYVPQYENALDDNILHWYTLKGRTCIV